jgi:hypothetical protein
MTWFLRLGCICLLTGCLFAQPSPSHWTFALSGDSRNCGDVIMPAIAAGVQAERAQFYWHLGDFRANFDFDQDILVDANAAPRKLAITTYMDVMWPDFIANQLRPFGSTPVFLAPGNHEFYNGRTRQDYIVQFADWINSPAIQQQRLKDEPADHQVKTYYHWIQGGVDFITLDNATPDQFSARQVAWFEGVLKRAEANPEVKSVVVGMHAALPDSMAAGHSMSDFPEQQASGRRVYNDLLQFQKRTNRNVYVFASHSHFLMEGIFDSDYWHANGGVLPGWIVGTAGAERYKLPPTADKAKVAKTFIYGYMLGTVHPDGKIDFNFHEVDEKNITAATMKHYGATLIHACFEGNRQQ